MTLMVGPDKDHSFPFMDVDPYDLQEPESPDYATGNLHTHKNQDNLKLKSDDFTEYKLQEMENDIDPDNHFYKNIKYYTDEQFKSNITMNGTLYISTAEVYMATSSKLRTI